ncbi:hypothetical protein E2C01_010207 [Portunus trituberculatus]|uniref:Uncharacterized protein n=1 Tax=Portunus trituberculatus TaxID=210409 RepID=A0A5B7D7V1_PORTR|nr:hypothetical protein [Portunus trituberculatus]
MSVLALTLLRACRYTKSDGVVVKLNYTYPILDAYQKSAIALVTERIFLQISIMTQCDAISPASTATSALPAR